MTLQPLLPAVLGAIVLARTKLLPEPVSVLIPIGAAFDLRRGAFGGFLRT